MKKPILALFGLLAALCGVIPADAQTQFPTTLPANTVWGRTGIGPGPGQAIPINTFIGLMGGIPNGSFAVVPAKTIKSNNQAISANPGDNTSLPNPFSVGTSLTPTLNGFEYDTNSAFGANTLGAKNIVVGTPAATVSCCTWLNTYLSGIDSTGVSTVYAIMPPYAGSAFGSITAIRTSDSAAVTPQNIISQTCAVVHDNTTIAHITWCGYDQINIVAGSANAHRLGRESSIFANVTQSAEDPYNVNPSPGATNQRFDCAKSGSLGGNDCTSAVDVVNNGGAQYISGIVFHSTALDTGVNTNPPAIALPSAYAITGYSAAATVSGRMFFDSSSKLNLTPVAGTNINGTNTNDNAAAGQVGEFISSTIVTGSAISLTNGTAASLTSISLTAGDWDVSFDDYFNPGATTTVTLWQCAVSTTTNTIDTTPGNFQIFSQASAAPATSFGCKAGPRRMSLSATTTVFAVTQANFTPGTMTSYGFIRARRVR